MFKFLFFLLCTVFCANHHISAQVSLVKDINPGSGNGTDQFDPFGIMLGSSFIFPATNGQEGIELWISDGTEDGTILLKDISPGPGSSEPGSFFRAFGRIYFAATTTTEGRELWVTDGTPDGTQLVMDIEPGAQGSDPLFGAVFKNSLYFAATSGADREIWWLDSLGSPSQFMNLNPSAQSRPRFFTVAGDKMYFAANEHAVNNTANDEDEPYVTDGTPAGTVKLINVTIDNRGAGVRDFTPLGDDVYFAASVEGGAAPNDHEIYKSDGTPGGTALVAEDVYGCQWLTAYNNAIYFFQDSRFQRLLSTGVISNVFGIHNNEAYHLPRRITLFKDYMIFPAEDGGGTTGVEIFASKGTGATTSLVMDIYPGTGSSNPSDLIIIGDQLLFAAASTDSDRELYITDGTLDGTSRVTDLNPGDGGSNPSRLVLGDGIVFFYAYTDSTGFELFKYEIEPSRNHDQPVTIFDGMVYPQPTRVEEVTVEWSANLHWTSARLIDNVGRQMGYYPSILDNRLKVSTSNLVPGVYYLHLYNKTKRTMTPVIIQ